jgi:hypothetical protein
MTQHVKESAFWGQVKKAMDAPDVHLVRIENTAGVGVPDVVVCCGGVDAWIELKVFHGKYLWIKNSQRIWTMRRYQAGGRSFILARGPSVMYLYDALTMMKVTCKQHSDGKTFLVAFEDLPTPLYWSKKPFDWRRLRWVIFAAAATL